ncbi:TadE/TadG family type IV pilus assembly protein [Nocardioides sp. LS1]|uniref:TadE/TadG family type IV pilus assembly protein n=1 Tax=Nocardioides sp. LS1 TaxID=1027620 RepID=UPI000F619B88|nr:pilus assembly protein TadG-related protein [Nocardioides sp. LS1]GCD88945.1 hypothetical protein NLS1_09510 [Nocardioides sp. LS1]
MTARRNRNERGAVAVLVAILATVLLGVGAMVVDVGEAYAKKSLLQTDVDLAVLAAAAQLTTGGNTCNPEVVQAATDYLSKPENMVPGQYALNLGGSPGDLDGYISCNNWKVTLWAPRSHIDYTLARTIPGAPNGIDVTSTAAAQIKAASQPATLPFFAVKGCDSGQQSIRNDSQTPATPTLVPDSKKHNNAVFTISPTSVASGTTSATITITGTNFKNVTSIGFTSGSGGHYTVAAPTVNNNLAVSFTVSVPSGVLAIDDIWYVRALIGTDWSDPATAQPFTVGPPKLYCDAKNEGNFGTLDVPRTDTNSKVLEWNMIKGIQPTLAIHPLPNGECSGQPGSVESKSTPVNGTNCVATEPGLKIAETNAGLITGVGPSLPGRLDANSTSNCSRSGNSARTTAQVKGYNINDDLLTCFITNGASINDLVAGNSVGTGALSADIFKSPRFFWIPVLDTDPSNGKKSWPIIDFRPGFISDQSLGATHAGPGVISPLDGLETDSSGIRELKVILFSSKALPEFAPTVGGESDYTGSGPKALVLVQ